MRMYDPIPTDEPLPSDDTNDIRWKPLNDYTSIDCLGLCLLTGYICGYIMVLFWVY